MMKRLHLVNRLAAALILLAQVFVVWVALDPNGASSIAFSFVGHPLMGAGLLLAIYSLFLRQGIDGTGG